MRLIGSFQTTVTQGMSTPTTSSTWGSSSSVGAVLTLASSHDRASRHDSRLAVMTGPAGVSTALLTDHYELTMVQAALASGHGENRGVFELFGRRLPDRRRYGVVAGTGRFLDALRGFR